MPELDPVRQDFTADAGEYMATLDAMIAKAQALADALGAAQRAFFDTAIVGAEAAVQMDTSLSQAAAAADRLASAVGDLRTRTAGAAAAEEALAGSSDTASESFASLSRIAEYLSATFGIVVTSTDSVLMKNAELFAMNQSLADSFDNIRSSATYAALSEAELAAMNERLGLSSAAAAAIYRTLQAEVLKSDALYGAQLGSLGLITNGYSRLSEEAGQAATPLADFALAMQKAREATDTAGQAAQRTYGWWGLTGNAIHWIVMGTLEIAATAVPALVALGAAAVAMYPAVDGLVDHFTNLITASGGLRGALQNMGGPVAALASGWGRVTAAVQPDVWMILGSAIDIATSKTGVFAGMAQQASNVLGDFATKVVADLQGPAGDALAGFFTNAVKYMIQWGQFLGNLGHTFLNVVNSMWGVGQLLLDVLVEISRALLDITSNPVGAFFIGLAAAMSAAYRYGQLLVRIWTFLGGAAVVNAVKALVTQFVALAAQMSLTDAAALSFYGVLATITDFATGPVGIAIGAIAIGLGLWYLATRNSADATTQLISKVEAAPPTVNNLATGIVTLSGALVEATKQENAFHTAAANIGWRGAADAMKATTPDVTALSDALKKLHDELTAQEQALAALGESNGQAAASMNVLSIQTELQDSKVQQLNQAWDAYMSLVTGGTGGLASFATSLQNITQLTATAVDATTGFTQSGTITATLQQFQAAMAEGPMGTAGASAWTNFDQTLQTANSSVADWAQTAETAGAITKNQFSQVIVAAAQEMIPFAQGSATATSELLSFADRSGITYTSLGQLATAYGGTSQAANTLNGIIETGTGAMATASQIAQNMASTLNTQVTNGIAAAALNSSGFNTDIQNMIQAQQNNTTVGGKTWQQWAALAQQALQTAQSDAATAAKNINNSLNSIPNVTTKYLQVITTQGPGYVPGGGSAGAAGSVAGGGGHTQSGYGAAGGLVHGPGTSTSDSVNAWLSRGEYVMNAAAVSHYGIAAMHALNARKLASGGPASIVPSILEASVAGGAGDIHLHATTASSINVGSRRVQAAQRTQMLVYSRRNPSNNWSLRYR